MKKLIALLLAMTMVLGMGATVMAADGDQQPPDAGTVTITKIYKAPNGGVSPLETFTFSTLSCIEVTDVAAGVSIADAPIPTIVPVSYTEGEATTDGSGTGTKTAEITLPAVSAFPSVGVYTYKFNEEAGTTAGVTYKTEDLFLVVTVIQGSDGKLRVAAVHCEGSHNKGTKGDGTKKDDFENEYKSGTLAVTKKVTGNLGDQSKYFKVKVTFTAAAGKEIRSTIKYSGGSKGYENVKVQNNTAEIEVKHNDTVTFENVPEGVTWKVEESSYTADGYDAATYSKETDTIAAGDADTCTITNNKEQTIDTGINMDSLPYFVIIGIVAAVAVVFFMKRRASVEE